MYSRALIRNMAVLQFRWKVQIGGKNVSVCSADTLFASLLSNWPVSRWGVSSCLSAGANPHTIWTGNYSFTCSQHSPVLHSDSAPAALWEREPPQHATIKLFCFVFSHFPVVHIMFSFSPLCDLVVLSIFKFHNSFCPIRPDFSQSAFIVSVQTPS